MTDDIVVRLREEGFITHMAKLSRESKILHVAADEIERLRVTNVELEVRIKSIKEGFEGCCTTCEPVGEINKKLREERDEAWLLNGRIFNEIERLRAERDHLRRLYCEYQASTIVGRTPQRQAENLEWDCFKETE
jgi:hypothetical protein